MSMRKLIFWTLLVSLVVSAGVTWPLARHLRSGIPAAHRTEGGGPRYMIPGDHLQLLYHFWLFADVVRGETPLFYNLYEFNQGADEDRYGPGSYYFPFGQLFAALDLAGGHALAWNLTGFLTVWIGYLAMVLLIRRMVRDPLIALAGGLPVILLPYLWVMLLGGSPTGFAMMWVPIIFLGLDIAVRDGRAWGGWMAGLALVISKWGDLHVFFFAFIAVPFWVILSLWIAEGASAWRFFRSPRELWRRLVWPLLPVLVCMIIAFGATRMVSRGLEDTLQDQGRSLREVALFSPRISGLWDRNPDNRYGLIYIGWAVFSLLGLGFVMHAWSALRREDAGLKRLGAYTLLLLGAWGIVTLALGPNVPYDPHHYVLRALRKLIPPYRLIRQPAKVFAILGPFLAVAAAFTFEQLSSLFRHRAAGRLLIFVCVVVVLLDQGRHTSPAICLLDREQGAYAAVAEDAVARGVENRAVCIPVWPGDSHWNSLTEYYSMLYRTKFLNGYTPSVSRQYFHEIFEYFEWMNIGYITDDRLDNLLGRGIEYIFVHEDAFPDKVSPFPVSHTLRALREHPRVEFVARDREVWAFRIERNSRSKDPAAADNTFLFPARTWEAEWTAPEGAEVLETDKGVSRDRFVRLAPGLEPLQTSPYVVEYVSGLRYFVRVRGPGVLEGGVTVLDQSVAWEDPVAIPEEWIWVELPAPVFSGTNAVQAALLCKEGIVDVDVAILGAGFWRMLEPGEELKMPADAFFRAGFSDPENGAVTLLKDRVAAQHVFYGPNLPLALGEYEMVIEYDSPASNGLPLAEVSVRFLGGPGNGEGLLFTGGVCRIPYRHSISLPWTLQLLFLRNADLTLKSVTLKRTDGYAHLPAD